MTTVLESRPSRARDARRFGIVASVLGTTIAGAVGIPLVIAVGLEARSRRLACLLSPFVYERPRRAR